MSIDIERILLELELLPQYKNQISLQTVEGETDPNYGTGQLNNLKHKEEDFNIPLFPQLKYVNSIIKKLKMFRTRVMRMSSKTCYSYHKDPSQRIHIPLITNENCFFVVDDKVLRCPADENYYLIDTTKKHTFVNASFEERIHLVGGVSSLI